MERPHSTTPPAPPPRRPRRPRPSSARRDARPALRASLDANTAALQQNTERLDTLVTQFIALFKRAAEHRQFVKDVAYDLQRTAPRCAFAPDRLLDDAPPAPR